MAYPTKFLNVRLSPSRQHLFGPTRYRLPQPEEFLNHPSISIFLESDIQTLEVIFREFRKLSDAGAFLVQAPAENVSNFLSAYNSHDSEEFDDDLEVGFLAPRVDSLIGTDDIDFNADDAEYL